MIGQLDPTKAGLWLGVLGFLGATIPATLAYLQSRKSRRTLGDSNGQGTLSEMTERSIEQNGVIIAQNQEQMGKLEASAVVIAELNAWKVEHDEADNRRFAERDEADRKVLEQINHHFATLFAHLGITQSPIKRSRKKHPPNG